MEILGQENCIMKIFTKKDIFLIVLIFVSFIISLYFYSSFPDKIPSHWNYKGEVDDYASKNIILFLSPILTLVIYLLMVFIPYIDPLKDNYSKFSLQYFGIRSCFVVFFFLLHLYILFPLFNITYFMVPLMSLLFVFLGIFMKGIKRNYFVGVRTPWTIHSDIIFEKTHDIASKSFIIGGIVSLLGLLFLNYAFFIFFIAITISCLVPVIYSLILFNKGKK